jgi:hypothetical protein
MSRQLSVEYPVKTVCEALGCPRSTYYYEELIDPQDAAFLEAIPSPAMPWNFCAAARAKAPRRI